MAVDAKKIFIGLPDQATTGAILTAPVNSTLPTNAADTIDAAFVDSGYVTEDGVNVSPTWNTNKLHDWSGANVRTMLDSFEGQVSFSLMEMLDEQSVKQHIGKPCQNGNVKPQFRLFGGHEKDLKQKLQAPKGHCGKKDVAVKHRLLKQFSLGTEKQQDGL